MKHYLILLTILCLTACIGPEEAKDKSLVVSSMADGVEKQFPQIKHLPIEEFLKLEKASYVLVDVRSPNELKTSTLPNSITKAEFEANIDQYKNKLVVSYCTIGYRSSKYAIHLQNKGFKAVNLKESILGWVMKGQKVYSKDIETNKVHVYSDAWNLLPKGYIGVYK
ncbi:rhodanese-like domain-containing protein [Halobacteriovorax sp. HLS]|uniref:rhodanese-like domain-containing protein n=1 Tax=Halobacteriovorax sp. HLS TaxID=2234000 RepID=UPI000FD999B6|nr:rhodanese-like domain-containing protein [Halobacteriovorax sp. HLS]